MMNDSRSTDRLIWRRVAPERAQRRELPRPLGDGDRERVGDHERADEERDDPEREQELLQEAGECVRVARVGLGLAVPLRTCVCGGRIARIEESRSASLTPDFFETRIWSSLPSLLKRRWALFRSKPGEGRAADVEPAGSELDQAGDGERLRAPLRLDLDPVSDLDVLLARGRLVDDDLVRAGPRAVDERERVEPRLGRVDREAQVRGSAEADHLAVRADQVRRVGDAADRRLDLRQGLHLRAGATRRTAAGPWWRRG